MCAGFATEKDGNCSSSVGEGEALDEEDEEDEDERGVEREEQSGNESEMNEPEEEVSAERHDTTLRQREQIVGDVVSFGLWPQQKCLFCSHIHSV